MPPRKNHLLPYVRPDRNGRLTYERRIPPEIRQFFEGKASIRRTLSAISTDCSDPSVLAAYGLIHSQVTEQFKEAKAQISQASALMTVDSAVVRAGEERFPLSKRDIAGIAGQVLLDIRELVANQQDAPTELSKAVVALAMKTQTQGISTVSVADFAVIARPALHSLAIDPSPADIEAIGKALLGYLPVIQADMQKLAQMDYSRPRLADVAPPKPKRKVSWRALFDGWLRSTGGVLEEDGYGVSKALADSVLRTSAGL